jgi:hypothetical protein
MTAKQSHNERCSICQQWFPATQEFFSPNGDNKLYSRCKSCRNAIRKGELVLLDFKCHEDFKRCSKCRKCKRIDKELFGFDTRCSDGLKSICKECESVASKIYKTANRDKDSASSRRWYKANSARAIKRITQWQYDNIEKKRFYAKSRRARKNGLPKGFTPADVKRMLNYWDNRCCICGREGGSTHFIAIEHWIPLSDLSHDNPGHVSHNIVPMCHSRVAGLGGCNNEKYTHHPVKWLSKKLGDEKAQMKLAEIEAYFEWVKQQDNS